MRSKLALLGGEPIRKEKYPTYITIGNEEKNRVIKVMDNGILSYFYGSNSAEFYGGPEVQALEREWAEYFKINYAISVNSATSGLYAAVGALGIGPGDEAIVTPYTMSATPAAILVYNAIPVFVDIEEETYCIDPDKIEAAITPRTKAIMVVHLFGHPSDMNRIMDIARRRNLKVIEDTAQAPGAFYKSKHTGTIGDIGVFSLNCHKVIQTGEGGVCVTNDEELANRLRLIRNHAEAVIGTGMEVNSLINMLGWNYRLTEIQAAIGREQLKKLKAYNDHRNVLTTRLTKRLKSFSGIIPPGIKEDCTHVYYIYAVKIEEDKVGISRDLFVKALMAEGIPFWPGYTTPLYMQPLYQKKELYGDKGCPFSCPYYEGNINYSEGICQTVEKVYRQLICTEIIRDPLTEKDMDVIGDAFEKIISNYKELNEWNDKN